MTADLTADLTAGEMITDPTPAPESDAPIEPETPEVEQRRRRKMLLLLLLAGLLAVLTSMALWYLIFRKPIPLPLPIPQVQMPAFSTSIYGPDAAMGIAASPDGSRIYVVETEGDRLVRIFDGAGTLIGAAEPPASTGTEHVPVWAALDPLTAELYVTDRPTGEVYVYDRDGVYQRTFAPNERIAGWQPVGIAFDPAGNLYVTDLGAETVRIEMIDRSGTLVRTFGENDGLSFANGVAVDKDGIVYVADSNNGRLLAYGPDGALIAQVGRGVGVGKLGLPRGVSVDDEGRIYVCDPTAQGVHVFRAPGGGQGQPRLEYVGFFGEEGIRDGAFSFPNGVATDARGRVYVTDTGNDRVQVWGY